MPVNQKREPKIKLRFYMAWYNLPFVRIVALAGFLSMWLCLFGKISWLVPIIALVVLVAVLLMYWAIELIGIFSDKEKWEQFHREWEERKR